jgi:hypothetical protein
MRTCRYQNMAKTPETPVRANMGQTEVKVRAKMDPVAKLLGTSRTVAYRPEFAHITGMVTAGLLLSQFWYWSECPTTEKREGWFYMTMDQISEQTGMIREEQETARKRLKAIGVLQEERRGNPGRMWFRVDEDRLYELLRGYAELVKAGIPQCDNPAIKNAGIPQSKVRELRNVARGNVTIKNAGFPQCILLESSSGESSIDFSGDGTDPPINPPEGEGGATPSAWNNETPNTVLGGESGITEATATREEVVWSRVWSVLEGMAGAGEINTPSLQGHLKRLELVSIETTDAALAADRPQTAVLRCQSAFTREWVQKRHEGHLQAAFASVLGRGVELLFVAGGK